MALLAALSPTSAVSASSAGAHSSPAPGSATLSNIACWAPGHCIVVGSYVRPTPAGASGASLYGNPSETLAEVSAGSSWRIVPSANAGAGGSQLLGVACPAASSCIAVGHQQPLSPAATGFRAPSYRPLVEAYSGAALRALPVPDVGTSAALLSVSCPQVGRCFAVGYSVTAGRTSALVEGDTGGAWKVLTAASPPGASTQLVTISCPSAQVCVAVGSYSPKTDPGVELPLVESLRNGAFVLGSVPFAKGTGAILYGVSCAAVASCVAVGQSSLNSTHFVPLVELWNGSTWTTASASAGAASERTLVSVSCPTGASCVAMGWQSQATTLPQTPLAERLVSGKTSVLAVPPATVAVTTVLCATESQCTAVGTDATVPYIGRFSGSHWVLSPSPNP